LNHLDVNNILALIERYTDPGKTGMRRFLPIFFNDENGNLISPENDANNAFYIIKLIEKNYGKYSESNFKYSRKISQLKANFYIIGEEDFPSSKDICIFFYEKDTIEISKDVKKKLQWMDNNAVYIEFKDNEIIDISDDLSKSDKII
jgi:hypothetical protein